MTWSPGDLTSEGKAKPIIENAVLHWHSKMMCKFHLFSAPFHCSPCLFVFYTCPLFLSQFLPHCGCVFQAFTIKAKATLLIPAGLFSFTWSINMHWWAKTLWPVTGEGNIVDHLLTRPHIKVWVDRWYKKTISSRNSVLVAGEMSRSKDLIDFDNGQIAMERQLVRVCLKMQGLWVAPGQQWGEFTNSGLRREKPQTCTRVSAPKAHQCTRTTKAIPFAPSQGLLWAVKYLAGMKVSDWNAYLETDVTLYDQISVCMHFIKKAPEFSN